MKYCTVALLLILATAMVAMASNYRNINSPEAKKLVDTTRNIYLLDVRTPDEYRQARLAGAVLIPVNDIERRIGEIPKNRPVLVYCAVGSRSNLVAGFLSSKGYPEVYNLADGIVGWYRNGLPISR